MITTTEEPTTMNTTETDSGSLAVNAFGLGVGDDWRPFWGSDFFMPAAWTASGYPGSRPGHAGPGARFCLLGDGILYASAEFLGVSERAHRWEHRPTPQPDGTMRYEDVGRGGSSIWTPTRGSSTTPRASRRGSRTGTATSMTACSRRSVSRDGRHDRLLTQRRPKVLPQLWGQSPITTVDIAPAFVR